MSGWNEEDDGVLWGNEDRGRMRGWECQKRKERN